MQRRALLSTFLTAIAFAPFAAAPQHQTMPVVGFLGNTSPGLFEPRLAALRKGLSENGYVEGQNAAVEYRRALLEMKAESEAAQMAAAE